MKTELSFKKIKYIFLKQSFIISGTVLLAIVWYIEKFPIEKQNFILLKYDSANVNYWNKRRELKDAYLAMFVIRSDTSLQKFKIDELYNLSQYGGAIIEYQDALKLLDVDDRESNRDRIATYTTRMQKIMDLTTSGKSEILSLNTYNRVYYKMLDLYIDTLEEDLSLDYYQTNQQDIRNNAEEHIKQHEDYKMSLSYWELFLIILATVFINIDRIKKFLLEQENAEKNNQKAKLTDGDIHRIIEAFKRHQKNNI